MMGDDERMTDDHDTAPGWDAIDSALSTVYGDAQPVRHWGTLLKWRLGGPDPLDGISVYERSDPVPHWHYVSYGLTELYAKENKHLHVSGWGFELTARLRRGDETEPPIFMANVLQNVARYVFETGNVFAAGHSLDLFGPIEEGSDTLIQGAIFYDDPELAAVDGPFGQVRFLQIVGVTLDERAAIRSWNADAAKPILSGHLPLLVTDLNRRSLLNDPEVDATGTARRWERCSSTHWPSARAGGCRGGRRPSPCRRRSSTASASCFRCASPSGGPSSSPLPKRA